MKINQLKALDKKRNIVYIDGRIAFVLYKGDLRHYGLIEGCEISEAEYDEIVNTLLPKRALLRVSHLLEKRDYTSYQLREKLKEAYYPENAIEFAINKLIGYGYVNDENYASRYIECNINRKSLGIIKQELVRKGISKDIVQKKIDELEEDGTTQDASALIQEILRKRHYYDSPQDAKERAKQYKYLLGKGFKSSDISRELKLDITW